MKNFTNQNLINAFLRVFGRNDYWDKIVRCNLAHLASRRSDLYSGLPIDDFPLWGHERRRLIEELNKINFSSEKVWDRFCFIGLHGRADGPLTERDYQVINISKVEAVKLLSSASYQDSLRLINSGKFVFMRLFADFRNRIVSPDDFCSWLVGDIAKHYKNGVRYFEIHNEPNLVYEGLGLSWKNGVEFSSWFLAVKKNLKSVYPDAKFGFPGLSPNGFFHYARYDDKKFLEESRPALLDSDFICIHQYWQNRNEMLNFAWNYYREMFPNKLLFVSEFSNPFPHVSFSEKAKQYLEYYKSARNVTNLGGVFCFVSSSSSGFENEVWVSEDGKINEIPFVVGERW